MKLNIRFKILLSVGITILFVLGISTAVHVQNLKQNYFTAIEWRSEAIAQGILNGIYKIGMYKVFTPENLKQQWFSLNSQCREMYELNKGKNLTHIALVAENGEILAHNNKELRNTSITNPLLLRKLETTFEPVTILDDTENIYHTFIPILSKEEVYLGVVDIGFPGEVLDQELYDVIYNAGGLLIVFLVLSCSIIFVLITVTVTKPIRYLVQIGERIAQGHLIHNIELAKRGDEIASLGKVFIQISDYLREISELAGHVSTGALTRDIRKRSKRDTLGTSLQEMLSYLQYVAGIASKIAEGNLSISPSLRSDSDAFGRAMRAMTSGLQSLIRQIRSSAEQISTTGSNIASFADQDMSIVQTAQASVEEMVLTMTEMGVSVEQVARNMDVLSASAEETLASVSVMTASSTNIAASTTDLTKQTEKAIHEVNKSTSILNDVTEKTGESRQLSQGTIQDALEGQLAVEEVMSSMDTIQQTNSDAFETITSFEQQTQNIGTILDMIDEITDQSSLLALNASILAAQAGSHGKGFAVIATEMKELANRVSASTKDIASIVQIVQGETIVIVEKIHESTKMIEQGVKRTQQAQKVLQKIIDSAQSSSTVISEIADAVQQMQQTTSQQMKSVMARVNSMTTEITMATNEQKSSTIQINQAVEHISTMASQTQQATAEQLNGVRQILNAAEQVKIVTEQNMESSIQIDRTSSDLAEQAKILLQSVDRFKLGTTELIKAEESQEIEALEKELSERETIVEYS